MQATTSDQAKQQENALYSSSSDASECGSDGDESMEDSDPDGKEQESFDVETLSSKTLFDVETSLIQ